MVQPKYKFGERRFFINSEIGYHTIVYGEIVGITFKDGEYKYRVSVSGRYHESIPECNFILENKEQELLESFKEQENKKLDSNINAVDTDIDKSLF